MKQGSILVVDDNKNVLTALRILLENYFERVTLLSSPKQLNLTLRELSPDIVLLDMNFTAGINTGNEGLFWLSEIKKYNAEIPVVLFTAYADIELAVKALKEGASDFVVKPWDNAKLIATLQSAYSLGQSKKEIKVLREKQSLLQEELNKETSVCWGISPPMVELHKLIKKIAETDANILITGENGTGKEVIAREIHRLSQRSKEALITVDMGAISESLFESELFGHVKGAFTDAKSDRAGKFEVANHGTLFLDEIGNLSYPLQAKLLSALQSRTIVRVGGNTPIPTDIRLISATNTDIHTAVKNKNFREDLLYRINTIQVKVPPLRERAEDIELLVKFFLSKYGSKYHKPDLSVSTQALTRLRGYDWPGNVRELEHTIEKAVILSEGNVLDETDFYLEKTSDSNYDIKNLTLEEAEHLIIKQALIRNQGNMSAVAAELGITRPTLYNKIKKYGL